jgi:hypothetical protein
MMFIHVSGACPVHNERAVDAQWCDIIYLSKIVLLGSWSGRFAALAGRALVCHLFSVAAASG